MILLNPQYSDAFNNRGIAHNAMGNFAAAVADFDEAIRLDPQLGSAISNRNLARQSLKPQSLQGDPE